jgi:hypothetical protein
MTFEGTRFSLVLSPGWWAHQPERSDDAKTTVHLLDPEADGIAEMTIGNKDTIPDEERQSLEAWSQKALASAQKNLKDFRLRTNGFEKSTRAGVPALSFVADYTVGGKPAVMYGTGFFHGERAVSYHARTSPDKLDGYRDALDTIIDTLQLK